MTSATGSPFSRHDSLGYQVNHLARLLAQALHDRIAPLGVTPGQFAQLLALYEEDGLTQTELCSRVRIEQPTMANTLRRMERDGLIERVPDPSDGRQSRIALTARAYRIQEDLYEAARQVNSVATRDLSAEETTAVLRAVGKAIVNLETLSEARY